MVNKLVFRRKNNNNNGNNETMLSKREKPKRPVICTPVKYYRKTRDTSL